MEAWFPLVVSMWIHLDKCQLPSSTDFPSPYESATATWKSLLPYIQCATLLHPLPHEYWNNKYHGDTSTSHMSVVWNRWKFWNFNSKGIWVRNHQRKAIRWQLKEVRSSSNHWCLMAIEIGLVIVKHVTIETFNPFRLSLSTWQLKLLIAFGRQLYNQLVGDCNFLITFSL